MSDISNKQNSAANVLRIGTRGSLLARTQTGWVAELIRAANPGLTVEIEIIQTTGDIRSNVPFSAVGTKGMFVKEIEQALIEGRIDLGVHSLKDMPSELPDGLELACVPVRESPFDALIGRTAAKLCDLPEGATVGTSSTRRSAQLRHLRPDLRIEELRGNLDTRIRKLDEGQYDAIVLAAAGLNRLGWRDRITDILGPSVCMPAAGQGALALEIRSGDERTREHLVSIHDPDSSDAIAAERAFLAALGGGCSVPVGAYAQVIGRSVAMVAMVAAPDGSRVIRRASNGDRGTAAQIGAALASQLLSEGANELLQR